MMEKLWTVKDVAEFLQTSVSYAYKAAERGELPSIRVGALLRFNPEEVERHVTTGGHRGTRCRRRPPKKALEAAESWATQPGNTDPEGER